MRRALGPSLFCLLVLISPLAHGQMTGNIDKLKADLYGDSLDKAVVAASALGSLKKESRALDGLLAALQLGTPPLLTIALLEAVELHQTPTSIPVLERYTKHRRQEIRVAAIKALGAIQDKKGKVILILIGALADSNPMVRARAARILGERKEKKAERSLFTMLKRRDTSAAGPLGIVAGPNTARHLGELIGDLPGAALANAFRTMLLRKDFKPDTLRDEVVKAVGRLSCKQSAAVMADYIASVPPKELRMSKNTAKALLEECQK